MPKDAEMFKDRLGGQPAPVDYDMDNDKNHPETVWLGGIETFANQCNVKDKEEADDVPGFDPDTGLGGSIHEGTGYYFFADGSAAGVRNTNGKWDVWITK